MKKALAMKCTQEQWDSIKDRIPEEYVKSISHDKRTYMVNNWCGFENNIATMYRAEYEGRFIHETFNAKIFLDACGIETDVYEITKEQVLELSKMNCVIKEKLCDLFPDAFKKELEVGKWYKVNAEHFFYLLLYSGKTLSLGFYDGKWGSWAFSKGSNQTKAIEATRQEVEAALICEAKKRGLVDGASYLSPSKSFKRVVKYPLKLDKGVLIDAENNYIFDCGVFATIIHPEKMTLEQIEKELGRKIELI